ncbi:putative effector protein [Blumeria hordei DH14]|uniref:Putative effector protein n=1 Tax=Blumeria graminis f. sp. hordei (strain DH14) TaxID=546991 RepID=N1J823_BLUG1|nr:putative effector protein [Blumeria hordei DH14]
MHCALAILLVTGEKSLYTDRLVITNDAPSNSHYGVYSPQGKGFPEPSADSAIFTSKSNVKINGTHVRAYCSLSIPGHEIAEKVADGLTDITKHAHRNFGTTPQAEEECMTSIKSLSQRLFFTNPVSMKSAKASEGCSPALIASLAYQDKFKVRQGSVVLNFPFIRRTISVVPDDDIALENVVYGGSYFEGSVSTPKQVLAWYLGHPHLFTRDEVDEWQAITNVGKESENGAILTKFLWNNVGQLSYLRNFVGNVTASDAQKTVLDPSYSTDCLDTKVQEEAAADKVRSIFIKSLSTKPAICSLALKKLGSQN